MKSESYIEKSDHPTANVTESEIEILESKPWKPQDADRDVRRAQIRNRVRNAHLGDNVVFKPAKPKPTIHDTSRKRVAVYARVSTKSDEQVSSIENQTRYYTEKVQKTENWELQEIYSDEGKSGTSMKKRKEFRRMLQDAKERKMDMIVCASVSRFARNVSDCIEQVRRLKTMNPSHPVGVYFETENIYTLDPDSSQMLKIHALLADWESANKSRRMILSYDQRICTGQFPLADLLGYKHTKDGHLLIVEDQAITVRYIFLAYIAGYTYKEIAETLTEKKRPTLRGRTDWNGNMVRDIMTNERRWGDLDVRKRIVIDYIEGTTIKNDNVRDAAFVSSHHEAIVSPQIARAAQMLRASNKRHMDGVASLGVITEGALKGFVSINPYWAGVDNTSLQKVCRSVYSEDELHEIEREARILRGEEHNNVVSMPMYDYQVPYSVSFLNRSSPTMTISPTGIRFNKSCYNRLEGCAYAELLYHPILQTIAVRACTINSLNAFRWDSQRGNASEAIHAGAFAGAVYEQMNWITDYKFRFKATARERDGERILFILLDEPLIDTGKKTKVADNEPTIQYIQYKNGLENAERGFEIPKFGISVALRRHRDRLANGITAGDIRAAGRPVDNPLIGSIPTQEEVFEELDQLLLSM